MTLTRNDLPASARRKTIACLDGLLADAIDLKLQTKQAHWNVKGENFIALHELFDNVAAEAEAASDLIAERIVQLGGEARGTARAVAKKTRLKEYPLTAADGQKHADALSSAIAVFNARSRRGIDETADLGDAVTADILTGIARGLDKQLWFVESHLKEKASAYRTQVA
ncbi:MAG: DNA starvation/stationary phase protection protein Dps [Pseudomonadota bacterium]|nr:DNA starvation/stationary phase protection protein Dps [Pseudomonadota bacterium]MDE3037074.1 DNA starvation/stationary phase protection protein Dps [Pseudomonadota bacterium]